MTPCYRITFIGSAEAAAAADSSPRHIESGGQGVDATPDVNDNAIEAKSTSESTTAPAVVAPVPSPSGNAESGLVGGHDGHDGPHDGNTGETGTGETETNDVGVGSRVSDSREDSVDGQPATQTLSDVDMDSDMIIISAPTTAGSNNMTPFDVVNRHSPANGVRSWFDFTISFYSITKKQERTQSLAALCICHMLLIHGLARVPAAVSEAGRMTLSRHTCT